jgi:hypothetical protein
VKVSTQPATESPKASKPEPVVEAVQVTVEEAPEPETAPEPVPEPETAAAPRIEEEPEAKPARRRRRRNGGA